MLSAVDDDSKAFELQQGVSDGLRRSQTVSDVSVSLNLRRHSLRRSHDGSAKTQLVQSFQPTHIRASRWWSSVQQQNEYVSAEDRPLSDITAARQLSSRSVFWDRATIDRMIRA